MSHILVVDDDPYILNLVSLIARDAGHQCTVTSSGNEAIQHCASEKFDLVVLDQVLPDIHGTEVAEYLRDKGQPFIFLSSDVRKDTVETAAGIGAITYITKPILPNQFNAALVTSLIQADKQSSEIDVKVTNTAVGILMDYNNISEADAFGYIIEQAKLAEISRGEFAQQILDAQQLLSINKP